METINSTIITDLTYLTQISNGDKDFIKQMIMVYLEQTPKLIGDLEKYLHNKDWKMFQAMAHKMKPSCSFFGLHDLFEIVSSMEEYADKEIYLEQLPEMIDKVKKTCIKAMAELELKKDLAIIAY